MPTAPNGICPDAVNGVNGISNQLKLHIPENHSTNGSIPSANGNGTHPANGVLSPTNGALSPNSNGPLSPPILDATPKKPPKAPPSRPILPMKKSKTLPIDFDEKIPPQTHSTLFSGKKLFVTKTLKEVHTIHQSPLEKSLLTRSPSPSYRRSISSASVETGSIAELARRHVPSSLISRSPSPLSYNSVKSSASQYSTCSSNGTFVPLSRSSSMNSTLYNRTPTPRRMFPQTCDYSDSVDLKELRSKEQAPVVFDANLSFVLGCNRQPVRQKFKPVAAHLEQGTSSNYLSSKIDNFLKRTDHVMDEWRRLGHKDEPDLEMYYDGKKRKIGRSKSATNIMIKGFTLFSRSGSRASSVCRSTRGISEDRTTVSEMDELSEVGGELAEERAAAALATERADAEAAERLRVERDNRDLITNNQRLQQASERLELELLHWRSAESGGAEPSDSEGSEADASASGEKYKRRYESAHREVQLLRAQLRRQHEDDLEQLVSVKKQLEKKVQDAYEEVEEQRTVAAQWKRKLQKLTNDMADLRSLLDEQTCRNNLLEKRQRKFDAELHGAQEELKRERAARERLSRERDQAHADKYALEQSLSEARLEVELKEERLAAAARELEERGGGGGDEAAALRRARADLERRARDQEEELDDLAGQIQLLESSKLRLEMLLEQQRKEARLEAAARDDELEDARANAAKKLKMLESQLESEHAERSLLLRERHELERRLAALEEAARAETHDQAQLVQRLKRDLKRYRALLRDAQTMLEQKEKEGGAKAQIRQLKNQVEDLELAVRAATKSKQTAEAEAAEATAALEEATRAKNDAAERALAATRDAAAARAQLDDAEEEAAELLKKYRASANALCAAQAEAREASARTEAAVEEARQAKERLTELAARLTAAEAGHTLGQHEAERRLEMRNKELESCLELEATARTRLEGQVSRLRDAHEALAAELGAARARDLHAADELRKLARQLRDLKEENSALNGKLSGGGARRGAPRRPPRRRAAGGHRRGPVQPGGLAGHRQRQRQLQLGRVDRHVPGQPQAQPLRAVAQQSTPRLAEISDIRRSTEPLERELRFEASEPHEGIVRITTARRRPPRPRRRGPPCPRRPCPGPRPRRPARRAAPAVRRAVLTAAARLRVLCPGLNFKKQNVTRLRDRDSDFGGRTEPRRWK